MKRRIIGIDLDDTLCKGQSWRDAETVLEANPIQKMIDKVNRLYKTDFIIIYTARQNYLISNTLEWLDTHNVRYHAISNHKIPLDFLIDNIGEPIRKTASQVFKEQRRIGC